MFQGSCGRLSTRRESQGGGPRWTRGGRAKGRTGLVGKALLRGQRPSWARCLGGLLLRPAVCWRLESPPAPQALLPPRPIPAGGRPPSPAARLGGPGRAPAQQLRTRPSLLRSRARPPLPRTGPVRAARRRPGRTGGCALRRGGPSPPPGGLASLRAAPGRPGGSGRRLDGGLPASGIVNIFCSCLSTFPVRLLQRPELTRMVSRLFSASRRCPRPRVRPPSETPSDPPRCSWGTERHRGLAGGTSVG